MAICPCCNQTMPRRRTLNSKEQRPLPLEDTRFKGVYEDGFKTGKNWDASWLPGGPWEPPGQKGKNAVWQSGFAAGLEIRLENKRFKKWWDQQRGRGMQRYTEPQRLDSNQDTR